MGDSVWGAERRSMGEMRAVSSRRKGQHWVWEILYRKTDEKSMHTEENENQEKE